MKSNRNRGYLLTDIGRVFKKKETYIGMIGVAAALFFSISSDLQESVISNFLYGTYGVGFLLSFVFCAFSYGTIYSDELETYYIRYSVIRGGLKKYVISKTAAIFLSSVLVMVAGCGVFGILCSLHMPWADAADLPGTGRIWGICLADRRKEICTMDFGVRITMGLAGRKPFSDSGICFFIYNQSSIGTGGAGILLSDNY